MRETCFEVGGKTLGPGHRCFIIAEAGVNHNGDLGLAKRLVETAFEVGADAVKFQTFSAERLVSHDAPKAEYQRRSTDTAESQADMLKRLELSKNDHEVLIAHCRQVGVCFLSTPFDEQSADMLFELGVPAYKIPSGELTNLPFLGHVASKGLPILLSTGMSNLGEVDEAVRCLRSHGDPKLALLHCVSNYPADPADVNLRAMDTLRHAFSVPVGYSDHTLGDEITLAAVAMGACVIEKHFTLDRTLPGPDHQASLEPNEMEKLVASIRRIELALGDGQKVPAASEANTAAVARKSLAAAHDLEKGHVLTDSDFAMMRPGTGLPWTMAKYLLGRRLKHRVSSGTLLSLDGLE